MKNLKQIYTKKAVMKIKLFSETNQISVLTSFEKEFKKEIKCFDFKVKKISQIQKHSIFEYKDVKNNKEHLLYAIKSIYERKIIK